MTFQVNNVVRLSYQPEIIGVVVEVDEHPGVTVKNRVIFFHEGYLWSKLWYMDHELILVDTGKED